MDCCMLSWKAAKEDDRPTFDDKKQTASNNNFLPIKRSVIDVNKCTRTEFEFVCISSTSTSIIV